MHLLDKTERDWMKNAIEENVESLYEKWCEDKSSVSPSFQTYFELVEKGEDPENAFTKPPKDGEKLHISSSDSPYINQQLKVRMMIERYRAVGHQFAKVDPLNIPRNHFVGAVDPKHIEPKAFGFTSSEL